MCISLASPEKQTNKIVLSIYLPIYLSIYLSGIILREYGSWKVPRSAIGKLETQESQW